MHPTNPFVAGPKLQNPQLFVGRKEELQAIFSRMSGVQPTSVNIVGEKQIGKSSLLYYFSLIWSERVKDPNKYVVIYVSLKKASCQQEENFYEIVAQKLLSCSAVQVKPVLNQLLGQKPLNRIGFSRAITEFENQGLLPVLCLDDFENLLKYQEEFDNGFYDNLRALMDNNVLMLILASREILNIYADKYRFVSSFFNVGHVIQLDRFTPDEAIELTKLPDTNAKDKKPVLNPDEQKQMYNWGQLHPYLLQLAASYLWEVRHNNKGIRWAKKQFEQHKKLLDKEKRRKSIHLSPPINQEKIKKNNPIEIFTKLPKLIGEFLDALENFTKSIIGLITLILLTLVAANFLSWQTFIKLLKDLIN
ncbi:MAG: AAA-like domain-containing protein [Mastigocoleus sp. MO_167.B18]|nr:AAA-like domain-containing protein [Mastigocoleus sp. MO_167.B18]